MMNDFFQANHPVLGALLAGLFTWGMTGLGAATIFVFKKIDQKILDVMLGFAAGVMIAASFWSLLAPSIEMAENQDMIPWLPALVGFLLARVVLPYDLPLLLFVLFALVKTAVGLGARLSYRLVCLEHDAPLPLTLDELRRRPFDPTVLHPFLQGNGF
nr:hypothetical protein [Candidatus Omnitrophota bacterium]